MILLLGIAGYIGDEIGVQDMKGNAICKSNPLSGLGVVMLNKSFSAHITSARHWTVPKELRHGIHTNSRLASIPSLNRLVLVLTMDRPGIPTWVPTFSHFTFEGKPKRAGKLA